MRRVARWLLKGGTRSVRTFIFSHPPQHELVSPRFNGSVTFHGAEIAYVFDVANKTPVNGGEHQLANTVSSYWARFVATGDPNHGDLPKWPAYDSNDMTLQFSTAEEGGVQTDTGLRRAACDYWDTERAAGNIPGPLGELQIGHC